MLQTRLGSLATATLICFPAVCLHYKLLHFADIHLESKYSHAAVWPLLAGYELPNGKRHYPTAAMVANLAKSTPDKPALMRHDDVVTFFHEMGHVFHGLLSSTKFARFHGTR
jgi:Zn-dependent oligopeptidase